MISLQAAFFQQANPPASLARAGLLPALEPRKHPARPALEPWLLARIARKAAWQSGPAAHLFREALGRIARKAFQTEQEALRKMAALRAAPGAPEGRAAMKALRMALGKMAVRAALPAGFAARLAGRMIFSALRPRAF